MLIGLTYDLRDEYLALGYGEEETAEFDRAETIDSLADALIGLGHTVDRIGRGHALVARLARGDRWDLVFNICEGRVGIAREAQVPAVLDLFEIPYTFSDPVVMGLCLHKGLTKTILREHSIPTPRSWTVERLSDLAEISGPWPLFAKPIAEGTGKGISDRSRIDSADQLESTVGRLLESFRQGVLVETYLPGREFTVGLLGTGDSTTVLGTLEIVLLEGAEPGAYSYVNKERCEELVEYRLVTNDDPRVAAAESIARRAWIALGCRDAGRVDLRCDAAGSPQFMEVNPLAGLHPHHSDLPMLATAVGMPYEELIDRIVTSANQRVAGRAIETR
ncbi:MAG: D-alanine--D-alanine ligase [Planctomycetales bacterium]|nr:D-alanine--D-alanine ligase [Planctomycetales bacterium]